VETKSVWDAIGGRKFLAFVICMAVIVAFAWIKIIDQSTFSTLFQVDLFGYIGGNLGADLVAGVGAKKTSEEAPPPPAPPAPPAA
jgi:hypothetical protein